MYNKLKIIHMIIYLNYEIKIIYSIIIDTYAYVYLNFK